METQNKDKTPHQKAVEYAKNKFKENYNKPEFHQEVLNTLKDYQAGWFNIT